MPFDQDGPYHSEVDNLERIGDSLERIKEMLEPLAAIVADYLESLTVTLADWLKSDEGQVALRQALIKRKLKDMP